MNCPRPSVSNGRTRIQTHSEPWLMLLLPSVLCSSRGQRGIPNVWLEKRAVLLAWPGGEPVLVQVVLSSVATDCLIFIRSLILS